MSRSATTLVAEIKTAYARTTADKLLIQKDMAELRDLHGWTQMQITEATGIPQRTVSNWLEAYDEGLSNPAKASRLTPESAHAASDRAVAKRVIAQAPMEVIERVISELPRERQQEIAAAAGNAYHKARVDYNERERNLTPSERSEREAAAEAMSLPVRQGAAGFKALGIVGHLDQARDDLHEITSDASLTPKLVREITRARDAFNAELQVACGLVGIEWEA